MSKKFRLKSGVTIMEILMIVIILGILATLGLASWQKQIEKERANRAKDFLKTIWLAERNLFAWKGIYSDNFTDLSVDNPNLADTFYNYQLNAANASFIVKAVRINTGHGFKIDEGGNITGF